MKRYSYILIVLLAVLYYFPVYGQGQAKKMVAIYVARGSGDQKMVSYAKFFASELQLAVSRSGKYNAVERTGKFLELLSQEQNYQRTGQVDESKIAELGKQEKVDYVLSVDMTDFGGNSIYVVWKLIDVESAIVEEGDSEIKEIVNMVADLKAFSEALTKRIIGGETLASGSLGYVSSSKINIDKFPVIYSMRNTIECDGVYKGPHWQEEHRNHTKKFYQGLSHKFNTKAFFVECSFSCPNAVPVDNYYKNLALLTFDTYHRRFGIFLSRTGNIIIATNYGDYIYDTKCQYDFNKWNSLQVSYNNGKVKIRCNDSSDEFDVIMNEDWGDYVISTTYWGTSNTFKGYIRNIVVGSLLIEK